MRKNFISLLVFVAVCVGIAAISMKPTDGVRESKVPIITIDEEGYVMLFGKFQKEMSLDDMIIYRDCNSIAAFDYICNIEKAKMKANIDTKKALEKEYWSKVDSGIIIILPTTEQVPLSR